MLTQGTSRVLPSVLNVNEVAKMHGVPRESVAKYCRQGKIPCFRIGSLYRITVADAESEAVRQLLSSSANFIDRMESQSVYFITADVGPVKIGRAMNPEARLKMLQTGYPYSLYIAAAVPGGKRAEREYHARFAAHRLRGEWFERCPEILEEIERLNQVVKEVSA